jgi:hypothetical protein
MSYFVWLALVSAAVLWFQSGSFMLRVTELIQRSVALCRDDFVASRLAALAEYFGAKVGCFTVEREGLDTKSQEEARAFVERVLSQRLHQRGRKRK